MASPGGSSFTFIKATEGSGYVDPCYSSDASKARAADLLVGACHFAWPSVGSAVAQADYFVAHGGRSCSRRRGSAAATWAARG